MEKASNHLSNVVISIFSALFLTELVIPKFFLHVRFGDKKSFYTILSQMVEDSVKYPRVNI